MAVFMWDIVYCVSFIFNFYFCLYFFKLFIFAMILLLTLQKHEPNAYSSSVCVASESIKDHRSQSTFYRPTLGNSRSVPHTTSSSSANSNFKGVFGTHTCHFLQPRLACLHHVILKCICNPKIFVDM